MTFIQRSKILLHWARASAPYFLNKLKPNITDCDSEGFTPSESFPLSLVNLLNYAVIFCRCRYKLLTLFFKNNIAYEEGLYVHGMYLIEFLTVLQSEDCSMSCVNLSCPVPFLTRELACSGSTWVSFYSVVPLCQCYTSGIYLIIYL